MRKASEDLLDGRFVQSASLAIGQSPGIDPNAEVSCTMKTPYPLALLLLLAAPHAELLAELRDIPLSEAVLDTGKVNSIAMREVAGRQALCLDGVAMLRGETLRGGAISVDVAALGERQFANLLFRAQDAANYEEAYLRLHKSGQADAVQYSPVLKGETNWQLFRADQASATFTPGEWVTLQVDFAGERALVTVGGATPTSLSVNRLALDGDGTGLGLGSLGGACFSNLRIAERPVLPAPGQADAAAAPSGSIRAWGLSPSRPFEGFAASAPRAAGDWNVAAAERDGLLMISRHRAKALAGAYERNSIDVVDAGVTLRSDRARTVELEFDASDRARVYLNGKPIAEIDNSFRAKGPLFRGDFGMGQQRLFLPLKAGDNELVVSVAERANGWGLAARLVEAEGVEARPLGR
jgi:hypothetical protein